MYIVFLGAFFTPNLLSMRLSMIESLFSSVNFAIFCIYLFIPIFILSMYVAKKINLPDRVFLKYRDKLYLFRDLFAIYFE